MSLIIQNPELAWFHQLLMDKSANPWTLLSLAPAEVQALDGFACMRWLLSQGDVDDLEHLVDFVLHGPLPRIRAFYTWFEGRYGLTALLAINDIVLYTEHVDLVIELLQHAIVHHPHDFYGACCMLALNENVFRHTHPSLHTDDEHAYLMHTRRILETAHDCFQHAGGSLDALHTYVSNALHVVYSFDHPESDSWHRMHMLLTTPRESETFIDSDLFAACV